MKLIPRRFYVLAALLILLNVSGLIWIKHELVRKQPGHTTQPVRLVASYPTQNVDQAERLSLHFDRAVGDVAQLNEQLRKETPFKLSPATDGDWVWSSPKQLDFVLNQPLPAGRLFEVEPAVGIKQQLGQVILVDNKVEFKTRALQLESCRLLSSDLEDVTFELTFNQKVAVDDALQALTVWDRGPKANDRQQLKVESLVQKPNRVLVLRCSRPTTHVLIVSIDGELTGDGATRSIGKSLTRTLSVEPIMAFLRTEVRELGINGFYNVDFYFTTGLKSGQKLPPIDVAPAVKNTEQMLANNWRSPGRILRLRGEFQPGKRYRAKLPQTLLSVHGKTIGEDSTVSFDIPDRRPQIEFSDYRGILSPNGNLNLDVQTVNVDRLLVKAARVHANNLVAHLQGEWKSRTSRSLGEQTLKIASTKNATVSQTLSLRDILATDDAGNARGIYHVSVDATDEAWVRDSAVVTITDLAMTVKRTRDEMLVWVTSLESGLPMADVAVSTVSFNNQTLATGVTDDSGIARIAVDSDHPDGKPWLVLAQSKDQTTWHRCDEGHWVLDQVNQSGRSPQALDVMLFTDRGTYRPGESIQLSGILRDDQGHTVPSFPFDLNIIRPDGRLVETLNVEPNKDADGAFNVAWKTPENSWTGPWRFQASLPGDSETIGSTHAYVEEFVPIRIDLKSASSQRIYVADEQPTIDVRARYLFGPPAAGLQVRVDGDYRATRFRSRQLPAFRFGPRQISGRFPIETITEKLSSTGTAQIEIQAPDIEHQKRYEATTVATVTEDGGRSVSRMSSFVRDTSDFHIGLKTKRPGTVSANSDAEISWALRTPADKLAESVPLQFELVRVRYDNVLRRVNGRTVWESVERTESVQSFKIDDVANVRLDKSGVGQITIRCPKTGRYRLIASDQANLTLTELEFFASDDQSSASSLALNQPDQIELKLDRETYKPGESGRLFLNSPFEGQVWLTLESDRVHWSRTFELQKKSKSVDIDVPVDLRGGGFITASVIRPVDSTDRKWLPHRARGIVRLETNHGAARIPVSITAASRIEPQSEIEVEASSVPGAMIQLWAVDEGILATGGFRTPNPHAHFFARRANQVTSSDIFGRLLPDHRRPDSMNRIGGDATGVDALRRNPVPSRRRKPAIVWSKFQRADKDGRVKLNAKIPNFTGELRWMAVALIGDQYGNSQKSMTVTSDFLVEATWPRFAAPGDRFDVPVRLINTTNKTIQAKLATHVNGPLELSVPNASAVVKPHATQVVRVSVIANGVGSAVGKIVVTSSSGESSMDQEQAAISINEFALGVRAANPLVTDRVFVTLEGGESFGVDMGENTSGTQKIHLTVSSDANVDLQPAVEHLMKYPYGCVEQTTSQIRALLAASELVSIENGKGNRATAARALTTAGVNRLWAMQLKSGALSYWPGQSTPHEWGTVYATLALLDTQGRGIKVDERFLNSLKDYLAGALHQSGQRDANVTAAMCLALSRLDSPPIGWMSRLTERIADLDMGGRSSLALAWFAAGRKDRALDALPSDTIDLPTTASYAGRFTSATAQRAQLARALQQIDASHNWLPQLITKIKQAKENGVWLSTLENALVVETLSVHRRLNRSKSFKGQVTIGSEKIALKPGVAKEFDLSDRTGNIPIKTAGVGQTSLLLTTTSEADGAVEDLDRLIRIRRKWLDRHGKPINRESIRVGDLVLVEVSLEAIGRKSIENVAIVDALPAGFEVENPRLRTSDQLTNSRTAAHTEFLDDRVVLFADALPKQRKFRYAIRAVTQGNFAVPPIQATCMYNESIESIYGAGRIQIGAVANTDSLPLATDPKPNTTIK